MPRKALPQAVRRRSFGVQAEDLPRLHLKRTDAIKEAKQLNAWLALPEGWGRFVTIRDARGLWTSELRLSPSHEQAARAHIRERERARPKDAWRAQPRATRARRRIAATLKALGMIVIFSGAILGGGIAVGPNTNPDVGEAGVVWFVALAVGLSIYLVGEKLD